MTKLRYRIWLLSTVIICAKLSTGLTAIKKSKASGTASLEYGKVSSNAINEQNIKTILDILHEMRPKKSPRNCAEIKSMGDCVSGVRTVYPFGCSTRPVEVFCDQSTDGGGWTVFQHRDNFTVREDFARDWKDYVTGFGNLTGEFWLGLENLHALVNWNQMEMRVDLADYDNEKRWAKYRTFSIGDSTSKYAITIQEYIGDAGDGFYATTYNGQKFSTKDQNNAAYPEECMKLGAWWSHLCYFSNLNGFQYVGSNSNFSEGILWYSGAWHDHYYSLRKTSMKVRPILKL